MKKSRSEIDGKEFGQKLFDENFQINFADSKYSLSRSEVNEYRKLFNDIRKNTTIKEQWESLWKWRSMSNEEDRTMFFKYQCLMRNKEVHEIKKQFINPDNAKGFYEHAEQNWYMPYNHMFIFENWLDMYFKNAEYTDDRDQERNKYPTAVTEMFEGDTEIVIDFKNKSTEFTEKSVPFDNITISDLLNWKYDIGVVRSDKYFRKPTMYLRIDLRYLDKAITQRIEDLINEKRKIYQIEKIGKVGKTMEMALMIHDMKLLPLSENKIRNLIQWTVKHTCTLSYIKEKLQWARDLIKHSTDRDFPPKTTVRK